MKIAVIYGGISTEREVSIKTGKEIIENLDKSKYEVYELLVNDKKDILKLANEKIDFAYIALHGVFGENGEVQAMLDILNIPYSGSGVLSSAICMDKDLSKIIVKDAGVRVIESILIKKGDNIKFEDINIKGDIILKPNKGGSSIGVHFVKNENEYNKALEDIFKIDDEILVEKVIKGKEISVPIIGGKVYPAILIEPLKDDFFDYKSKYENGGAKEEVKIFPDKIQSEIDEFTKKVYNSLKCKGFARVDYLIEDDKIYFLEINSLPGMTANSLLPKSTLYKGYNYSETLDLLIQESIKC